MHPRKFNPLGPNHPAIGDICPACKIALKEGDVTTLIPLGPGNDPTAQKECREGKGYNAVAAIVHWACATGEE